MKLARYCLDNSIVTLKVNIGIIVVLECVKFLINSETHKTYLNYKNDNSVNGTRELSHSKSDTNIFRSSFDNILLSLSSWYTYDINQMEATRTEIVNVINTDISGSSASASIQPLIITRSFINFSELLQFNNLKNMIKLALIVNLNIMCILVNMILLSYFLIKNKTNINGIRRRCEDVGKRFLKAHLVMNMVLLLVVFMINSMYILIVNKDTNLRIKDYLIGLISNNNNNNENSDIKSDDIKLEDMHFKYETFDRQITLINVKLNIVLMIFSIGLLAAYSFLIKLDYVKRNINNDDVQIKHSNEKEKLIFNDSDDEDLEESDYEDEDDEEFDAEIGQLKTLFLNLINRIYLNFYA